MWMNDIGIVEDSPQDPKTSTSINARRPLRSFYGMANSKLTIDLAGRMTTYELRLEVERRGLLEDLGDMDINHATLLRRLVQVKQNHHVLSRIIRTLEAAQK